MKMANLIRLVLTAAFIFLFSAIGAGSELAKIRAVAVQKVFHNGEHNAFTDLCRFNDNFYLAFRSCPDGHSVFPTSSIIVLKSADAKKWIKVLQFNVPNRDVRDPHFLVFKNTLFVYTGAWFCESSKPSMEQRELNKHLGYGVWSQDGDKWHGPKMLEGTYGHYIWRAAAWDDQAYLCGRRKHEFREIARGDESKRITESALLVSDDGLVFKTAGLFQEEHGDETAFLFEPNGELLAIARKGTAPAEICRSRPPFAAWQRKDLDRFIGGPLLTKWGNRYLVGGRKIAADGMKTTMLYWLVNDQLYESLELPSAGDNSYPGFVPLSEQRALVSYYSSHEKDASGKEMTAIYLATIEIEAE